MTFVYSKKIYGYECDVYGHLNNANYLQIYEAARAEALVEMKLPVSKLITMGIMLFVIKVEVEYKKGISLEDTISVNSKILTHDRLKAHWYQEIFNSSGDLCSIANVWGVYVSNGKPTRISKDMFAFFENFVTKND